MPIVRAHLGGGFTALPGGRYPGVLTNPELKPSKSSDFPVLNIRVNVQDSDGKDRVVWARYSHHPNAIFRLIQLLERLDIEHEMVEVNNEDGSVSQVLEYDTDHLSGQSVVAVIVEDEYEGKPKNDVKDIFANE